MNGWKTARWPPLSDPLVAAPDAHRGAKKSRCAARDPSEKTRDDIAAGVLRKNGWATEKHVSAVQKENQARRVNVESCLDMKEQPHPDWQPANTSSQEPAQVPPIKITAQFPGHFRLVGNAAGHDDRHHLNGIVADVEEHRAADRTEANPPMLDMNDARPIAANRIARWLSAKAIADTAARKNASGKACEVNICLTGRCRFMTEVSQEARRAPHKPR
jgi:hypothetical protein